MKESGPHLVWMCLQEAIKCMRHSKRTTLTASDVDGALNLRNLEVHARVVPIFYSFGSELSAECL